VNQTSTQSTHIQREGNENIHTSFDVRSVNKLGRQSLSRLDEVDDHERVGRRRLDEVLRRPSRDLFSGSDSPGHEHLAGVLKEKVFVDSLDVGEELAVTTQDVEKVEGLDLLGRNRDAVDVEGVGEGRRLDFGGEVAREWRLGGDDRREFGSEKGKIATEGDEGR
jgi:hypothetical protein